ncbi:MAG: UDP-2,4-diacetamido-2,4,6-trideoxy-beta-L-altropyranose hydrolase [Anaerolineae bacterium]|nr:UDP-2,4-diacetamido-2,4,6-trideoxy-beta-L-altropyranose hydrolase [Anaerolineae bacterium]
MTHLLIRADGNSTIGAGHLMRCLALGQAWQEAGGTVNFAVTKAPPALEKRLCQETMGVNQLTELPGSPQDAMQTISLAQKLNAKWVVVDGYHFDAAYQQALKQADLRLLVVDDYGHASHYSADLVLNQNMYAHESLYTSREPFTQLLLGSKYVLLRREFWSWRGWRREIAPLARKVLVTLGGADPDNVTLKVIQALRQTKLEGLQAVVVVGSSNPHWETLRAAVGHSSPSFRLERDVTDMPALMAWADLAISAGGSTCWELAFMGLPSLVLILADNQRRVAEGLDAAGVAFNLGHPTNLSPAALANALHALAHQAEQRTVSARRGQELIDGCGAARVAQQMRTCDLTFRPVQAEDCRLIWEWANDPSTRANSFSSEPISWEAHLTWFKAKLADPQCRFYLVLAAGEPAGQIRYQLEGEEAVVSVGLAPNQRGRGYGSQIIRLVSQQLLANGVTRLIHAYVKPDNAASLGAFSKAGFVAQGVTEIQGSQAIPLVLRRETQP